MLLDQGMLSKKDNFRDAMSYEDFKKYREFFFHDPDRAYLMRLFVPPRSDCKPGLIVDCRAVIWSGGFWKILDDGLPSYTPFLEHLIITFPVIIDDWRDVEKINTKDIVWRSEYRDTERGLDRATVLSIVRNVNRELAKKRKKRVRMIRAEGYFYKTCPVCSRKFETKRRDAKVCRRMACRKAMYRQKKKKNSG